MYIAKLNSSPGTTGCPARWPRWRRAGRNWHSSPHAPGHHGGGEDQDDRGGDNQDDRGDDDVDRGDSGDGNRETQLAWR